MYTAYYEPETGVGHKLIVEADSIEELAGTFTGWDEVYENFLEGYYWCLREDLGDRTVWETDLGMAYLYLRNAPDTAHLFDSGMFEAGVMKTKNNK
jgi:hypothetical protein